MNGWPDNAGAVALRRWRLAGGRTLDGVGAVHGAKGGRVTANRKRIAAKAAFYGDCSGLAGVPVRAWGRS